MILPNVLPERVGLVIAGAISMHTGDSAPFDSGYTAFELLGRADRISDPEIRWEFRRLIEEYFGKSVAVQTPEMNIVVRYGASPQSPPANTKKQQGVPSPLNNHWAQRIRAEASAIGFDPDFAVLVAWKESGMNPSAKSPTGAGGLFQLTGIAITDVSQNYPVPSGDRMDPEWNIYVGVRCLTRCAGYAGIPAGKRSRLDDDERVAVYACFNVGPGTYAKLKAGAFTDESVVNVVNQQAASLKRGGPGSYLSNVRGWLSA